MNCPDGQVHPNYTVGGIDISYSQANVDYDKAQERGVKFVMIRSGWGIHRDYLYDLHRAKAQQANIPWGTYWYWHPYYPEVDQAQAFRMTVGMIPPLGCWMDFERNEGPGLLPWPQLTQDHVGKKALDFVRQCDQAFAQNIGIYTSPGFWRSNFFSNYQLAMMPNMRGRWIAQWFTLFTPKPTLPDGWTDFDFWQFSARAGPWAYQTIPFGVIGSSSVDVDVFNGDMAKFESNYHIYTSGYDGSRGPSVKMT